MKRILQKYIFSPQSWDICIRLLAEFRAPLTLSVAWTWWNWYISSTEYHFVEKWFVNFFAIGWIFTQWNRVKKQKNTEDGFVSVENRIGEVVTKLEKNTERQIGMTTGGDSFAEFVPAPTNSLEPNSFALLHRGDYPLYDIDVRVVDIQRIDEIGNSAASHENIYHLDMLAPQHVKPIFLNSPTSRMKPDEVRRYNIFISARNGSTTQMLQMTHVNGILRIATAIDNGVKEFYSDAAKDYPRGEDGEIDWTKHDRRIKVDLKDLLS
jgi:hypothetical protein